tara:strand:- start:595 stop:1041 length:447 start_codon:yes stop_codon:yes gene_type:complete
MAITSAICNSFKVEILKAVHNFTISGSGGNTFNLALYTDSASLGAGTTAYTTSNEISNTSGSAYQPKGKALTSVTPVLSSSTAVCDFADVSFTSASFTARGCMIFNDTATGDPSVCCIDFGSDKTVTSGTFTIQFPTADASNAIIRIA